MGVLRCPLTNLKLFEREKLNKFMNDDFFFFFGLSNGVNILVISLQMGRLTEMEVVD
jgi:hypothetical protein